MEQYDPGKANQPEDHIGIKTKGRQGYYCLWKRQYCKIPDAMGNG
jgi:hypothetical protein